MAVILTIAAVICLIIAVVFAFTQCSSQKKDEKATTSPSTEQVTTEQPTTEYGDDNSVPVTRKSRHTNPKRSMCLKQKPPCRRQNRRRSMCLKQSRRRAVISAPPNRHRHPKTYSRLRHRAITAMSRMLKKTDCFLLIT